MQDIKNNDTGSRPASTGTITLFLVVLSSLICVLFLPLIINYILGLSGNDNRQIYSEYRNLYNNLIKPDRMLLIYMAVQLITLIIAIRHYSPRASRLINEQHKGLFATGFKTVLSLWYRLFISGVATVSVFAVVAFPKDGLMTTIISLLFFIVMYIAVPYLAFGLVHSVSIAYLIGACIRKKGTAGTVATGSSGVH